MPSTSLTTLSARVAEQLISRRQTVAVAETSAGGLISAALLAVPGASAYYRGGTVTYTRDGVAALFAGATDMEPGDRGACEPFARYLAASVAAKLDTDWAVSEAGAAGPSGNRYGDPAGHTWVAVAGPDGFLRAEHLLTGSDDREANMEAFAAAALNALLTSLTAD
ncbi:CinA family protein [Pseudonocardia yunnanensis]|uniref:CinA family protein n=1 Tax=Pseudonocardia yunnanensis TaxID=58107 RepID=A0ABW4F7V8_9PSEU